MMTRCWPLVLLIATGLAQAHGDEVHDATPAALNQPVAARAEAHSELFELVAVADGQTLRLYLDAFASNAPVAQAHIEVETGQWKGQASADGAGRYAVRAPWLSQPGRYPLLLTIQAGEQADLLETTLHLAAPAQTLPVANASSAWLSLSAAGLVLAGIAGLAWHGRRTTRRGS